MSTDSVSNDDVFYVASSYCICIAASTEDFVPAGLQRFLQEHGEVQLSALGLGEGTYAYLYASLCCHLNHEQVLQSCLHAAASAYAMLRG